MTLEDVGMMSGEDMVRRYGAAARQLLVSLAVAAVRKGDDDEVKAIDGRMQEVDRYLDASARGLRRIIPQ
ncbi:hypothetical protein [Sphingomonas soli]|uniref:hypothetical protein n=1 Tax=Sphingomonas soli TaxID=266127 RepID=UPI000ACC847D|nr:hypothetical protein [Sphingomonas soli]